MDWLLREEKLEGKPLPGAFRGKLELILVQDLVSLLILTLRCFFFFQILRAAARKGKR